MSDDPRYTSKLALIQAHYAKMGDQLEWSAARYRRLANALQLTVHELGAFFRIKPGELEKMLRRDKFPATVELHLTILERTVYPGGEQPVFPHVG